MQAHLETVGRLQGERSPDAALLVRRELANLRESLGAAIDDTRWEDAGQLAVPLALATSDFPHLELLGQLRRLADAPPTADGALCLVAAGASAWLRGEASAAVRLLTTALDRLPADHPLGWAPHWFRGMSSMYTGDVTAVLADTTALLRFDAPEWVRATAVCNAALACLFSGDRTGAGTWLAAHAPLLDAVGAVDGFVAYTRGELCAERDPRAALAWYELAYRQNDERGIIFNREVAGVARAAVLTRLGRRRDAAAACRALVESLRAVGMWPQLWTTLRITAELLVDLGDPDPAAELLDAADADALAPAVHGPGRERLRRLRAGAGVPRTRIGGRTEAVTTALDALARHA
jgi:hypothetical protein